jgi:hypothetical protein
LKAVRIVPTKTAIIDIKTQHNAIGLTLLTNLTPKMTKQLKTISQIVP